MNAQMTFLYSIASMVERLPSIQPGFLRFDGQGGCAAEEMADFLDALNASYQAIARIELVAYSGLAAAEALRRYGFPPYPAPWLTNSTRLSDNAIAAEPLIVHRVVLESPGIWEFLGTLNPLEVLRKYLNDRHERRKDRNYREKAESRSLEIENALAELEVVKRLAELEREFGPGAIPEDVKRRLWAAEVRKPLERLAEFDSRGLIDGGSAATELNSTEG